MNRRDAGAAITVDEGRITVSPPVGWKREPRSKDYLARYVPGGVRTYPSVTDNGWGRFGAAHPLETA